MHAHVYLSPFLLLVFIGGGVKVPGYVGVRLNTYLSDIYPGFSGTCSTCLPTVCLFRDNDRGSIQKIELILKMESYKGNIRDFYLE